MTWEISPLTGGLGGWRELWDSLNNRLYQGHPFSDSLFVDAMLKHFGKGDERLCIHRTQGRVDGLLILKPRRYGVWTQFTPSQAPAVPVLIEKTDILKDIFSTLSPFAWMLELLNVDPEYSPPGLLENYISSRIVKHALTMNIELKHSFDDYWEERSKNLVKNMRRYQRRIENELGVPVLRVITEPDLICSAVTRYGELESNGWKNRTGTAVNIKNRQGQFYKEMMMAFAAKGQAMVAELWLNEDMAASRLIISGGSIQVILKTTYSENLAKFAPGRVLLKYLLEYLFEENRSNSIEFYTNATQDQLAWATGNRYISHVMLFRTILYKRTYDAYHMLKNSFVNRSNVGPPIANRKPSARLNVNSYQNITALPPESLALFQKGEKDSFDLSLDWFLLLQTKVIFPGKEPRYYAFERNGVVDGVWPMMLQTESGLGRKQVSSFTCFYSSLYRPLILDSLTIEELAVCLKTIISNTRADVLRLNIMDPLHSTFDLHEEALHKAGLKTYRFFCSGNWYLPVNDRSFSVYFQGLSSRVRNTFERRQKKFLAQGRGRLEIVTSCENLPAVIESWRKIYQASWKVPEPYPDFMPALINLCAVKGWMRLGLAYYDEEPIAAQLWLVNHGRASIYKLAYDEKFAHLSPGTILTGYLMRHVIDVDKVHEVDYLIGDDAYKEDWMSHRRERLGLVAYNPRTVLGLIGMITHVMGCIRKKLAGVPVAAVFCFYIFACLGFI